MALGGFFTPAVMNVEDNHDLPAPDAAATAA
jgi:hypothetical protein